MRLVIDPHILENAFYYESSDHLELTQELVLLLHATLYVQELAQKALSPKPCVKIFISYKSENRDWAELIHGELEKEGYKPWFDRRDLRGGDTWMSEIDKNINEATIFLSILSEWAAKADGIHKRELQQAKERQLCKETFIIPLKVDGYELPANLRWLEGLQVVDSSGDWFGDLRRAIDKEIGHQAEIAALAQERERTCLCIDNGFGYSEVLARYRNVLKDRLSIEKHEKDISPIEKFEKWKQILEDYAAIRPKPSFTIGPGLKAQIDRYKCRAVEDEVFVKVAIGAQGHLVSEGGVSGKCRQGHELAVCPTVLCLCRTKTDRVLSARNVLYRLRDRRRELESLAGRLSSQPADV